MRDRFAVTAQIRIHFDVDDFMTEERREELIREAIRPLRTEGKGGGQLGTYQFRSDPAERVEDPEPAMVVGMQARRRAT